MPWPDFAAMTDDDVKAIVAYLRSVPPIRHAVPAVIPPGKPVTGAYLTFPPPPAWDAPHSTGWCPARGCARGEVRAASWVREG